MKAALLFLAAIIAVSYAKDLHLSQTQMDKAHQHSVLCVKQSKVKPEILAAAKKGVFTNDEALKKFVLCFFQKAGLVNYEGHLDIDVALSKLPKSADIAGIKKALEECRAKEGKDAADTAYQVLICYHASTHMPVVF